MPISGPFSLQVAVSDGALSSRNMVATGCLFRFLHMHILHVLDYLIKV